MTATLDRDRDAVIRRTVRDAERWSGLVDTLLQAFHRGDTAPPSLASKLEELRHKRDTVVTKVEALKRHRVSGWGNALRELDDARRQLREAWRSVLGTLDRESQYV